jgi:Fe2+ or Zn2+ uptake regulation protein
MFRPTTNDIVKKVKLTNPKAGRMSVSRALKILEARGAVIDNGDVANCWELP